MTKSFIKKIFSFNKSKEQEMEQISIPDKSDIIEKKKDKNERTKNNEISIDTEKEEQTKNQKSTPTKCDKKSPPLESHSDKAPLSPYGKIIVTNTIREKKDEEILSESSVEQKKTAWFGRLKKGLSLSSQRLSGSISDLFVKRKLDEATLQELEDILIQADLGVETATRITNTLASSRYGKDLSPDDIHTIVADEIKKVLEPVAIPLELDLSHKPHVILLVGVNGTGKTTTIGKLAAKLTAGGLKVMLAAGDTFRAAAIEQLHIWGERTDSPVISTKLGADAASLAFDAFEKAKKANSDVLIIDTAGRLQNKSELMDELAKIIRVLRKHTPQAPHTILQTLDATTGQNALNQVDIFRDIAGVNGLVMTKLDGTARGGILVAIAAKYKLPVYFIGIGENIEDLQPFSASDFAETIAGKHV
ncbi:signal recognition particle-docking protein FtsY [Bartonella sp. AD13SXNS]|uniref:signal recognition particle-docking protein FtsY n=1 Tax=Bartonella sp. AD13SXNS TaxID=3243462 RepID=UPI0035CF29B8